MDGPRPISDDAKLQFEDYEFEEDADETELAIVERLIAELLVRSWRRERIGRQDV